MHPHHTALANAAGHVLPGYVALPLMLASGAAIFAVIVWPVILAELGFKVGEDAFSSEALFVRSVLASVVMMLAAVVLQR